MRLRDPWERQSSTVYLDASRSELIVPGGKCLLQGDGRTGLTWALYDRTRFPIFGVGAAIISPGPDVCQQNTTCGESEQNQEIRGLRYAQRVNWRHKEIRHHQTAGRSGAQGQPPAARAENKCKER